MLVFIAKCNILQLFGVMITPLHLIPSPCFIDYTDLAPSNTVIRFPSSPSLSRSVYLFPGGDPAAEREAGEGGEGEERAETQQ